jgi:DNA-binding transcriptional ArsR family regulator
MSRRLRCVQDPGIVELAEGLRLLSDPNRLRILCLLLKGERCVCEVERELGISQQLASHHLTALREGGFLASRREKTSIYYSVEQAKLERTTNILLSYLGTGAAGPGGGAEEACCAAVAQTRARRGKA